MSETDENGWNPIETCPITGDSEEPHLLLWVANGGFRGKGCPAFGNKFESGRVRASGFLGDFKFTHWQLIKPPVSP
jgi:hypothetical protein